MVSFLKESARKTEINTERNPAWIACLPTIHFLDGSLHPFEDLNCANFQDKDKNWWLANEFEREKEDLKLSKWSR